MKRWHTKMVVQFIDEGKKSIMRNAKSRSKVYGSTIGGLFHTIPTSPNDTKLISTLNSVPASVRSNTYSSMFSRVAIGRLQYWISMAMICHERSMRLQIILTHDM